MRQNPVAVSRYTALSGKCQPTRRFLPLWVAMLAGCLVGHGRDCQVKETTAGHSQRVVDCSVVRVSMP